MNDFELTAYGSQRQIMFVCDKYPTDRNLNAWVVLADGSEEYLGYMVPSAPLVGVQLVGTFNLPLDDSGEPKSIHGAYVMAGETRSKTAQVTPVLGWAKQSQ